MGLAVCKERGSVVPDGTGLVDLRFSPTVETVGYYRVSLTGQKPGYLWENGHQGSPVLKRLQVIAQSRDSRERTLGDAFHSALP